MIKINLLRDPFIQPAAKGGGAKKETADVSEAKMDTGPETWKDGWKRAPAAGVLICLLFSCFGVAYFFWLGSNVASGRARNAKLSEEKEALGPYLQLEEQLRERNESLRKKEGVLAKLKKQQQFPVYFLQELANSLPDNVWFAKIASKGQKVEIRGESLTEDAIYQFRDNLVTRGQWFRNVNFLGAVRRDKRLEFTLTFELVPA
jgi:Tfp pilus assembly protein PilN